MLGHKMFQRASLRFDTVGTVRGSSDRLSDLSITGQIDATRFYTVVRYLEKVRPSVIVNCIGIVKIPVDNLTRVAVNSLFPLQLARLCKATGIRLIHISTDCVFSGKHGNYSETQTPDPRDAYGQSKLLGEPTNCLVLRTSMVGRELGSKRGLLEWFLVQNGVVFGYLNHRFNGLTTLALSELICDLIDQYPTLTGTYHIGTEPAISKYDLLCRFARIYGGLVEPAEGPVWCDRSLNVSSFRDATGIKPPSWNELELDLYNDSAFYESFRGAK